MTYTPKPGDRVTLTHPNARGEFTVHHVNYLGTAVDLLTSDGASFCGVGLEYLAPVAPPLPPEPAVGEVVWANGRYWQKQSYERDEWHSHPWKEATWDGLAADAEPVVPLGEVVTYLAALNGIGDCAYTAAKSVEAEFGWGR